MHVETDLINLTWRGIIYKESRSGGGGSDTPHKKKKKTHYY